MSEKRKTVENPSSEPEMCVFFYGACRDDKLHKGCLSQWQKCEFAVDGIKYFSAGQYVMAEKARVFDDEDALRKILATNASGKIKELGRKVRGFDSVRWDKVKFDIVCRGNKAKFSQDRNMLAFLLGTGDAMLVEASPNDTVWGIGLKDGTRDILDPGKWRGENLLGKALMKVRAELAEEKEEELRKDDTLRENFQAGKDSAVNIVALRYYNVRKDTADLRAPAKCACRRASGASPEKVEISLKGPETENSFIEQVKASVKSIHTYSDQGKDNRKVEIVNQATVVEFAKRYKKFIFGVLKTKCMFKICTVNKRQCLVNGKIDAEEVFNEVMIRFLQNKELKNLDLYKEGAGKTPFRNYLSVVVQNVFRSMARKDLVEEIGPDGKPVMTEELDEKGLPVFDTDEKGNVKKDDAGRPVVKMKTRMISRYVADLKAGLEAWGDHKNRLWAPPPSNKEYLSLLLDVITLAYLEVHERKGFRDGWAYDAMTAIFEEAQPERDVAKRLVKQGIIKSEGTLHTAKSRFAEAWREKWMALYRDVVRSQHARGREDSYMAEVWREARDMVGKKRNLNILRKNIAEWALSYATKATGKGADRNVRHRM